MLLDGIMAKWDKVTGSKCIVAVLNVFHSTQLKTYFTKMHMEDEA